MITLILIFSQAGAARAFYSPVINGEVSDMRQHIQSSQQKNGIGTWWNVAQKAEKKNQALNAGYQGVFTSAVKEMATNALTDSFWDGISLLVKSWLGDSSKGSISNCLRDDIWEAQALQEQVLNEVMKASILSNTEDASILWNDFQNLESIIELLKSSSKDKKLWFPDSQNFYVNCPYGDFTQAWQDLTRALKSFENLGGQSLQLGNFGVLAKIAKKRAIQRAQEWIKANQLTLTIGGKQGANPRSLFNGPGVSGLAADFKTEWGYAKNFAELVFVNTYKGVSELAKGQKEFEKLEDVSTYANDYTKAYNARDKTLKQMESAIKFNLSFNNVAQNSLKEIDKIMFETNGIIEDAFSSKTTPENLKTFCEKINAVIKKQCKNKNVEVPACK